MLKNLIETMIANERRNKATSSVPFNYDALVQIHSRFITSLQNYQASEEKEATSSRTSPTKRPHLTSHDALASALVASLRELTEYWLFGDQTKDLALGDAFFHFLAEKAVMASFAQVCGRVERVAGRKQQEVEEAAIGSMTFPRVVFTPRQVALVIQRQLLQSLSLLGLNLTRPTFLYYFLSADHLHHLLSFSYDMADEDIAQGLISLLKGLSLRLDAETLPFFFPSRRVVTTSVSYSPRLSSRSSLCFPLYDLALQFLLTGKRTTEGLSTIEARVPDTMSHIALWTLTLQVYACSATDQSLQTFLMTDPDTSTYFITLVQRCVDCVTLLLLPVPDPSPPEEHAVVNFVVEEEDPFTLFPLLPSPLSSLSSLSSLPSLSSLSPLSPLLPLSSLSPLSPLSSSSPTRSLSLPSYVVRNTFEEFVDTLYYLGDILTHITQGEAYDVLMQTWTSDVGVFLLETLVTTLNTTAFSYVDSKDVLPQASVMTFYSTPRKAASLRIFSLLAIVLYVIPCLALQTRVVDALQDASSSLSTALITCVSSHLASSRLVQRSLLLLLLPLTWTTHVISKSSYEPHPHHPLWQCVVTVCVSSLVESSRPSTTTSTTPSESTAYLASHLLLHVADTTSFWTTCAPWVALQVQRLVDALVQRDCGLDDVCFDSREKTPGTLAQLDLTCFFQVPFLLTVEEEDDQKRETVEMMGATYNAGQAAAREHTQQLRIVTDRLLCASTK